MWKVIELYVARDGDHMIDDWKDSALRYVIRSSCR